MRKAYYEVEATVWDSEKRKQVKKVVGVFDEFFNAYIFKTAYEHEFCTTVNIITYERRTEQ